MDIKIQCPCGQKIAFEVEPENGAMPCDLSCPACQADVTPLANENIRQQLPATPPTPPVPAPEAPRMRISLSATAAHAPASTPAPSPAAAETPAPAPATSGRGPARAPEPSAPAPARGADGEATISVFLMGCVGIFGGAIVGLIVWFLIAKMGLTLRILAVLVGAGAGLGARVFCREGDKSLGGVAAVVAVIGMFIGGPLILDQKLRLSDADLRELYNEEVKASKEIVAAIPTGTDAEISKYLAKDATPGEQVSAEDIQEFRKSDEYKDAKDLAAGKRSFESYAARFRQKEDQVHKDAGGVIAGFGALRMLSIWLIGLVGGTAYKFAAG
ncbi:MAG: hypothetical protein JNL10_08135 [Verrucomicrobiales bacterium]|nr:hypothetical protein [Verrucomicrobiales bacterium]